MYKNRFFIPQTIPLAGQLELPQAVAHHITTVLRMRSGEKISLFNGEGGEYRAIIKKIGKHFVCVDVVEYSEIERESQLNITLVQALSRGQKMDFTIQKSVELGVNRIIPLATQRSSVKLNDERLKKRFQHWQGVIISACEQCGRNQLPELLPLISLEQYLEHSLDLQINHKWVLHPDADCGLKAVTTTPSSLIVMIGCEGGFTVRELEQLEAAGFVKRSVGSRIVRTETAALMALSAIQALWGDF